MCLRENWAQWSAPKAEEAAFGGKRQSTSDYGSFCGEQLVALQNRVYLPSPLLDLFVCDPYLHLGVRCRHLDP
jgi:hypothetical protein